MTRSAVILLIAAVSAVHCSTPVRRVCTEPDQVWNECGSRCEPGCGPTPSLTACPAVCVPKCSCKPGYVMGPDGKCIPKGKCPVKKTCSDPNAVWRECGSYCEATCVKPKEPQSCAAVCVPKCSCKPGYVIGPNGRCISTDECSKRTRCVGPSQVWNECGSGCERRCIEPKDPIMCPAVCMPKCSCARGYSIGPNGNCITDKECSKIKKCGRNEIWNDCGNNCETKCNDPPHRPLCPAVCVAKCMCMPGYVRSRDGKCVSRNEC